MLVVDVFRSPNRFGYALRLGSKNEAGIVTHAAQSLMMVPYTSGEPTPILADLAREEVQELVDGLWEMGFVASQAGRDRVLDHARDVKMNYRTSRWYSIGKFIGRSWDQFVNGLRGSAWWHISKIIKYVKGHPKDSVTRVGHWTVTVVKDPE